ncbi:MAG: flagellar hook protein [Lachnospiraceae bacterium]|nr:flagellar hook protein [Lachnospiraceae bacterium]
MYYVEKARMPFIFKEENNMIVQHNLQAMNSNRMLGITQKTVAGSTEKLSSGYRINRAADDAAGLSISEKMRKQIRGLSQASANAEDGISSVQTAEGALQEVTDMLQRMNELAVQAANGTNSTTDRQYIQDEIDQLVTEVDRVSETTKFNETYLLKGDTAKASSKAYTINYAVTYTLNTGSNYGIYNGTGGGGGQANNNGVEHKVNYVGKDNLYIADVDSVSRSNKACPVSADVIRTGGDVTKYLTDCNEGLNGSVKGAFKNSDYAIFKNSDATLLTVNDTGTNNAELKFADGKLTATDASTKGDAFIFDTVTNTVIKVASGNDLSDYMDVDTSGATWKINMKDRYRMLDEVKIDKHLNGGDCTNDSHGTSVGTGTSLGTGTTPTARVDDIVVATDFKLDVSRKQLYDSDGNEVSGVALRKYFDENGNYKGGLYTSAQATQEVLNDDDANATTKLLKISTYITKNTAEVTADLSFRLHVGADSARTNKIETKIQSMSAASLGVNKLKSTAIGIVDETGNNATDAIDVIAEALQKVSTQRSSLGAVQNRLEHTIRNLDNVVENTQSAESAIRDTDMATEMVKYSNANVLSQAGQSMLAQANQSNQGVLSILG